MWEVEEEILNTKGVKNEYLKQVKEAPLPCDKVTQESCSFDVAKMKYTDITSTMKYIYRTEGALAFTKGVLPRMCINIPATALSWGTYELVKGLIAPYVD